MGFKKPLYTQIPNDLLDNKMKDLTLGELKVLLVIFRQTVGYHKDNRRISLRRLAGQAGISLSTVQDAVGSLIDKGLIEKIGGDGVTQWSILWDDDVIADPTVSEDDTVYREPVQSVSEVGTPSIKEKIKEKYGDDLFMATVRSAQMADSISFEYPERLAGVIEGFANIWVEVYGFKLPQKGGHWIKQANEIVEELGEVDKDLVIYAGVKHHEKNLSVNGPSSITYAIREALTGGMIDDKNADINFGRP